MEMREIVHLDDCVRKEYNKNKKGQFDYEIYLHELAASSSVGSPSSNTANCSDRFSNSL